MRRFYVVVAILSLLALQAMGQAANHAVISEVGPMAGASSVYNTGEYIELYNPLQTDVTFGANVQIISGNTSGTNAAEWQISLAGKTIKAYGFLLIGDGGVVGADVAFPASKNLANSGTRSCVQLRDGAAVIDAFGWDQATTPLISAEGTSFKPSSTSSDKKSFERKSGLLVTAPDTLGNAWDSNNNSNDFFENTSANANPQNSSSKIEINPYQVLPSTVGSAVVAPAQWKFDQPTTLTLIIKTPNDTLRGVRFIKPGIFTWTSSNISVQPATILKSQSGDTTTMTNFALSAADSIVVTISGVVSVDSTDEIAIDVRTSTNGTTFGSIQNLPKTLVYGTPRTVAQVKVKLGNGIPALLGKWVVTRGVVTVSNEFTAATAPNGPAFMQDATGGVALYDSSVALVTQRGDDIIVLGKVAPFNELYELTPCSILQKMGEGISFDTTVVTIPQIKSQPQAGVEQYESRLIRINNIGSVNTTAWNVTGSGTNYNLTAGTDTIQVRISARTNLANLPTPSGAFDVVGVLGQFGTSYQIQPRSVDDIVLEGNGPRFTSQPVLTSINSTGLTFTWTTDVAGTSTANYGTTTAYGSTATDTNKVLNHTLALTGLKSATIYNIQLGSASTGGTTLTQNLIVSTASKTSTGQMNVYFNKSVNNVLARGDSARTVSISAKLVSRISAAMYSIDAALYSLSGTVGSNIASALVSAQSRGVKLRVIGENDNKGTLPWGTLGTSVIFDAFDPINAGAGLMHNKFVVIDNRDTTSDTDDWVWMGSWNATDPGDGNDAQNVVEIQDKALANAYTTEFNEMWGSSTDVAN
ncbi:MAG: hypothetical protein HY966_00645, partial [Ignavibacteriales bacterium]|nr:hypothetical protein [Ignavibacteriales bacterium]